MDSSVRLRRLALGAFFFLPGISAASWITRTPAIRDALGASISQMGLVLFGLSVGSMTGVLSAGWFVSRFGTRAVTRAGLLFMVASLFTIAIGVIIPNALVVALGLGFFGLGMGATEIAMNVDGADVERVTGKPLLHALHGFYSLGTVCGALIGIGLTAIDFPVQWHLAAIGLVVLVPIIVLIRFIPPGFGIETHGDPQQLAANRQPVWRDPRLALIGVIVLALALAEGSASDWLPILMVDDFGLSQASVSLVFLGFAAAMTVGRFGGGYFLARYGRVAVIRACAVLGTIGLAVIIFADNAILASAAVLFWGLGASLGFPVALSAAGDSGPNPNARVKLVAMAGYIAFLVGPPLLGFVGEAYGLRNALFIVFGLVAIAALSAPALEPRRSLRTS